VHPAGGFHSVSEYQYYEFQAIDRPLTEEEMQALRSCSTRARITPTSFVNHYEWGNFKGDEDAWMEKYFDAFLYVANWGTHVLKLRLPSTVLPLETAKCYCRSRSVFAKEKAGKVIITFVSEDESGGDWDTGEGWLASLVPNHMASDVRSCSSPGSAWIAARSSLAPQAGRKKKQSGIVPSCRNAFLRNLLRQEAGLSAGAETRAIGQF
jgi:hypothetical protein